MLFSLFLLAMIYIAHAELVFQKGGLRRATKIIGGEGIFKSFFYIVVNNLLRTLLHTITYNYSRYIQFSS